MGGHRRHLPGSAATMAILLKMLVPLVNMVIPNRKKLFFAIPEALPSKWNFLSFLNQKSVKMCTPACLTCRDVLEKMSLQAGDEVARRDADPVR